MIPLCLQCWLEGKDRKAKRLPVQDVEDDHVFCSTSCAARFAINHLQELYGWCDDHGWFHKDEQEGSCSRCPVDDYE